MLYEINKDTIFRVGDEVYVLDESCHYTEEQCPICDGKGYVTIKDNEYECPECNGAGCTEVCSKKSLFPEKGIINLVRINISEDGSTDVSYLIRKGDSVLYHYVDSEVFASLEEARKSIKD